MSAYNKMFSRDQLEVMLTRIDRTWSRRIWWIMVMLTNQIGTTIIIGKIISCLSIIIPSSISPTALIITSIHLYHHHYPSLPYLSLPRHPRSQNNTPVISNLEHWFRIVRTWWIVCLVLKIRMNLMNFYSINMKKTYRKVKKCQLRCLWYKLPIILIILAIDLCMKSINKCRGELRGHIGKRWKRGKRDKISLEICIWN